MSQSLKCLVQFFKERHNDTEKMEMDKMDKMDRTIFKIEIMMLACD